MGLTKLSYLDIGDNYYTSTIPTTLATNLPALEFFYADNCVFDIFNDKQSLDYLKGMDMLRENWMDYTRLSGSIPTEIGLLTNMRSISWSFATITGTIPTEVGLLTDLDRLWLFQNELVG